MMNIPYNNYKTQLCKFWEKEGKCKFNKNCSYAHGDYELRKPYEALPKEGQTNDTTTPQNAPINEPKPSERSQPSQRSDFSNLKILMNNQDQFCCNQILQAN